MLATSFRLVVTAQSIAINTAIDHRRDVFDDGFWNFVRRHEIAQSLKCLQQNNKAEPRRRRERYAGTKRQLFICRSVDLFQLHLAQTGFKARIGGVAWLHVGGIGC